MKHKIKIIRLQNIDYAPWDKPIGQETESDEATIARMLDDGWELLTTAGFNSEVFIFSREK